MARVQTAAQQESFERNGFKEYEYICCGLPDACEICRALDGKIFKVKDMMVGENAPPMHPNCHCSTSAAAASREDFDAWLDAKAAGETDLGFEEWGGHRTISKSITLDEMLKENVSKGGPILYSLLYQLQMIFQHLSLSIHPLQQSGHLLLNNPLFLPGQSSNIYTFGLHCFSDGVELFYQFFEQQCHVIKLLCVHISSNTKPPDPLGEGVVLSFKYFN